MLVPKSVEDLSHLQKKSLELAVHLARLSVESSQKILQLEMQIANELFEDGASNARIMAQTKSPQEAMALRMREANVAAEKMLTCSRDIAQVTAQLQQEVSKIVSHELSSNNEQALACAQALAYASPLNAKSVAQSMDQTVEAARKMLEQIILSSNEVFNTIAQSAKCDPTKTQDKESQAVE